MTICERIQGFIEQAIKEGIIDDRDQYYLRNRLLALFQQEDFEQIPVTQDLPLLSWTDLMIEWAVSHQVIEDLMYQKDQLMAAIMDLVTPYPSVINDVFWKKYRQEPHLATDYFYRLSQMNDYIKTRSIAKNVFFKAPSRYGELDITINLSKPEKDPKQIALEKNTTSTNYPSCALCMENEGYKGRINHAARQNHRMIRFELKGNAYAFQYSPYQYYQEHSIILNESHVPMVIDRRCFENLLAVTEILPHYFAGSNADLPIVGGSILSHDHYQAGNYSFPMDRAQAYHSVDVPGFSEVDVELVDWPMSVIRLRADKQGILIDLAELILEKWKEYSNPELDIISSTNDESHNTITPIARRRGNLYELDLVLRNNRTNDTYPSGIFHPHPDVQHIKKENIGLIEVLGLAILPPRLVGAINQIKTYLLGEQALTCVESIHQTWALSLKEKFASSDKTIDIFMQHELGLVYQEILEHAGVFKRDAQGEAGFKCFMDSLIVED